MTVFVVDDEPGIRSAFTFALRKAGFGTEEFSGTRGLVEGLERVRPALVILDLSLEKSDAVEVIKVLADSCFRGAVQLLSGNSLDVLADVRAIGDRRRLRMLPVLRKPCRMRAVVEIAEREFERLKGLTEVVDVEPDLPVRKGPPPAETVCLAQAIDQDRVEVWYQPKYELRGGSLVGAECLARVRRPCGAIAFPGSFLPDATPDTLVRLTELVLRRALSEWPGFARAGHPLRLSVNIPCSMLLSYPFAPLLRDIVPVAPDWPGLVLEVTEEDAIQDVERAQEAAAQLRIYGIDLSIDDFGVGYSSLSRLRELAFKEIKLDRSLVQDCATSTTKAGLCKAVVELARVLGATVVAEGVETVEELAEVRALGCDIVQGYLLGRPMPRSEFLQTVGHHGAVVALL